MRLRQFWQGIQLFFDNLRTSLRARIALGVALPVLLAMSALSGMHYWREYQLVEEQAHLAAVQLGEMMIHSLNHAMLFKDDGHLLTTLEDVNRLENIDQILVIGLSGKVLADSSGTFSPYQLDLAAPECQDCHQYPVGTRPRTVEINSPASALRIAAPIDNLPQCYECHSAEVGHLGMLLIDMTLGEQQRQLMSELRLDLLISIGLTVLIAAGMYVLIHYLVVRRIDLIRRPLARYSAGNLSVRIERTSQVVDELCQLGATFNHMADEIERYTREQEERSQLRQRAIIEERERIARELHDGIAQVLAYVNTKAMAVRLMLQNGQIEAADQQLAQLEEAARGLFVDVREAILGLKLAGEAGSSLPLALKDYVDQLARLSDLPVIFEWQSEVQALHIPAETELQLLRIVQEALTNARKHAAASQVWVSLQLDGNLLHVQVRDDGRGFDPQLVAVTQGEHYGLESMRQRAEMIGASLHLESRPGTGTRILVQLNLNGS